jgi:hypothetical protein
MATRYSKHIISEYVKPKEKMAWQPTYRPVDKTPLLRLDGETFKGAKFFVSCSWFWTAMVENESLERNTKPHKHDYDEIVGMIGTNWDDPWDLDGEIELTINGEKNIVTRSSLLYLPAGLEHGPFREVKMNRPIFQFECGMAPMHT